MIYSFETRQRYLLFGSRKIQISEWQRPIEIEEPLKQGSTSQENSQSKLYIKPEYVFVY